MGMGIASLSLGACALVVAWIPCLGMFTWPVSGIGLLLGAVGLIVAFTRQGNGLAFPIAGTATSFVALGIAVYQIMFWHRATSDVRDFVNQGLEQQRRAQEQFKQQFADKFKDAFKNPPIGAPVAPTGAITLNGGKGEVNAALQPTDPPDPARFGAPCKVYTVDLAAGKTYQIDMMSKEIDPFLRLENPAGKQVAMDDDGGEGLNARIVYNCTQAGTYRVIATCVGARRGPFTLTVQQK
jgi:hypothetical protein